MVESSVIDRSWVEVGVFVPKCFCNKLTWNTYEFDNQKEEPIYMPLSHLLNYLIWTIKNGGQVSSNVEKPRKSVDMAEVSNTHSL